MESIVTTVTAEGSLGITKWLIGAFRGVQLIVPRRYEDRLRIGRFYVNPEASRKGFDVVVRNYSNQLASISFFQFQSIEGKGSNKKVHEYPMIRLSQHHQLTAGTFAQFALPWKEVVLATLEAGFVRMCPPKQKRFRFWLAAHDEFRDKFYYSADLDEFHIRSNGLFQYGDSMQFTDDELERVGWYRKGTTLFNKALDMKP